MAALELTSLGHACALIEVAGLRILCDPHFHESYGSGLFTHDPPRTIDVGRLPRHDVVFLSHRHRDHFDVRSLAMLDKGIPVFAADDPELRHALTTLGFRSVRHVKDWSRFRVGGVELVATPSLYRVPEHGLMVIAPDMCVWNMVDTVVDVTIVARAAKLTGRGVDVLLWPYQPLKETAAVEGDSLELPRAGFEAKLETLELIAPRLVVPYADGQLGTGPASWLNHYRFPLSVENVRDFAERIGRLELLVPGQRLSYDGAECRRTTLDGLVQPAAATAPSTDFDATRPVPPLSDLALGQVSPDDVGAVVTRLCDAWSSYVASSASVVQRAAMHAWSAEYDLVLEHGDGAVTTVRFTATERPETRAGAPPRRAGRSGLLRMNARTLLRILDGELHFVSAYLGGLLRSWSAFYRVEPADLRTPELQRSPGASSAHALLSPIMFLNTLVSRSGNLPAKVLEHELEEARRWNT
jgi:L-ascorbate metabolism protein UlaG (beta-lactamase superfamily)